MNPLVTLLAKMLLPTLNLKGVSDNVLKPLLAHALAAHFTHIQKNGLTVVQNVAAHLRKDGVTWENPGSGHPDEPAGELITRTALYWLIKSFGVKGGLVVDGIRDSLDKSVYVRTQTAGMKDGSDLETVTRFTAQALVDVVLDKLTGVIDPTIQNLLTSKESTVNASSPNMEAGSQSSPNMSKASIPPATPENVQIAAAVIAQHAANQTDKAAGQTNPIG